jgi:hypothetical protein
MEGEREVEGPSMASELFSTLIKVKKVNIGTKDNPKNSEYRILLG